MAANLTGATFDTISAANRAAWRAWLAEQNIRVMFDQA